jgi:hypothetical protein
MPSVYDMNLTSKPQDATLQGITNRLDGRYIRRGGNVALPAEDGDCLSLFRTSGITHQNLSDWDCRRMLELMQGGPAATAQGGPAATAQGRPAATARVPSTPSVIELVNSMQILYEESQRRLHQTEEELRLAHVKIDILEDRSPRTGRKRDHTNTEREREPKIRKELEEDAKSGEEEGEEAGGGREDGARDTEWVVDRLLSESGEEEIPITEE